MLVVTMFLGACETVPSNSHPKFVVKSYNEKITETAASEIESNQCPVLGDVMMPDYKNLRDQAIRLNRSK